VRTISNHLDMPMQHLHLSIELISIFARQMGTSIGMLEKHYSHLIPSFSAEQLAGKKFKKYSKGKKKKAKKETGSFRKDVKNDVG